jgi:HEAT repeat protein
MGPGTGTLGGCGRDEEARVKARSVLVVAGVAVVLGGCASAGGNAARGFRFRGPGVGELTTQTKSPDPDLRREAALALGRRRLQGESAKEVREVLAGLLRSDSEPLVRSAAATSLGRLGGEESVPLLAEGLTDRSPLVRADVCSGLGTTGAPAAISPLAGALTLDASVDVRCASARALGNFHELAAWQALVEALGASRKAVETAAYQALRRSTGERRLPQEQAAWQKWLAAQKEQPEGTRRGSTKAS